VSSNPAGGMNFSFKCCMLSGRGLCIGLMSIPEDSYEFGVSECDNEASIMKRTWPTRGCCVMEIMFVKR
jgi:hypothetical protein